MLHSLIFKDHLVFRHIYCESTIKAETLKVCLTPQKNDKKAPIHLN